MQFSLVVPLYNEAENVKRLVPAIIAALDTNSHVDKYEVICIDDASTDDTYERVMSCRTDAFRIFRLKEHSGQTAAIAAGIKHARFEILGLMDADLQSSPRDIQILLDKLILENFITFLIIAFALNLIIFIVLQIRKQVKSIIAIKYAKVVIGMAFFGYVICIQVVKYLWGRVRFRELDAAFSQFTPWYCPQGITGFDSFPSGHAATGFMLLAIFILLEKKKLWLKNLALVVIVLWGILLASSRVVIGAHYASDVLFGSFFIIITFIYFRNKKSSN